MPSRALSRIARRALPMGVLALIALLGGCGKPAGGSLSRIGLITTAGTGDSYAAQLKGAIYSVNPKAEVVDLISNVEGDVRREAFLADEAVANFPGGVIFVVGEKGNAKKRPPILVRTKLKKYYLAPDNGVLSYILAREGLEKAWVLNKESFYRASDGAPNSEGPDMIAPIAARLAGKFRPEELGTETKTIELLPVNLPHTAGQSAGGEVIHITAEGDLVTNIPRRFAPWLKEGNLLRFTLGKETFTAPLVESATEVRVGKYAAVYSEQGRLQIVVNRGSAARVFNATVGDSFTVRP
jgi:S-adenosylmethionine hydrolase